jgi:hypothetical protein
VAVAAGPSYRALARALLRASDLLLLVASSPAVPSLLRLRCRTAAERHERIAAAALNTSTPSKGSR